MGSGFKGILITIAKVVKFIQFTILIDNQNVYSILFKYLLNSN